jgi:uncharacterized protein (TIGR00645 family)
MSSPEIAPPKPHSLIEQAMERVMFVSRWLLAPIYLGLAATLVLILVEFVEQISELIAGAFEARYGALTVGILSLVDLSLIGNLVLMVMFAGYENFVSKFDLRDHKDKPDWMGTIGFGDLKLKLMASIVAISAIHVLEAFMNINELSDRDLGWTVGIHMTFVVSGLLLALMDKMMHK